MDPKFKPHRISVSGHGNKVVTCLQHDDEKLLQVSMINAY